MRDEKVESSFFFFNDTATTEIYTLSLHDALPIWQGADDARREGRGRRGRAAFRQADGRGLRQEQIGRAPSELQSPCNLVCRLLLEKKKISRMSPCNRTVSRDATIN